MIKAPSKPNILKKKFVFGKKYRLCFLILLLRYLKGLFGDNRSYVFFDVRLLLYVFFILPVVRILKIFLKNFKKMQPKRCFKAFY